MGSLAKKGIKNIIMTVAIPVLTYVFFRIICTATGHPGFGVGTDMQTIIYTTLYSGLIALAMSYNLPSGRFDFSVGATILLAGIVGGNFAKDMGFGAAGFLLSVVAVAMVCGLISGLLYVLLGLPPMVVSIGVTMVYEAIGLMYNKSKGVKLIGKNDMLIFSKPPYSILVVLIAVAVLIVLFNFTKFGYNWRALRSGQKIAVDIGINEKRNAVACYVIAGVLLGIAACMYLSQYGTMSPESGLGSSSFFMSAFLPLFIGGAIEKYSDKNIGVLMGALAQACITSGFAKLGFSNSLQTVLNGVIVMGFLIYTSNSYKLVLNKMYRHKLEKALEAQKQL